MEKQYTIIRKTNNILKSLIFSWIVFFGIISIHPDCRNLLSKLCPQETSVSLDSQLSVWSFSKKQFHSFAADRNGTCCKEKQTDEKGALFSSGQYPEISKQASNAIINKFFPYGKNRKLQIITNQKPSQKNISINIFTQFFLC